MKLTINDRKIITVKVVSFRHMVSKLVADVKPIKDPVDFRELWIMSQ